MSPGGRTPSSSRSTPELPPLSNIVTTALTLSQGLLLSPPSRLGRPVPPPKHPTFNSRSCIAHILYNEVMHIPDAVSMLQRELADIFGVRLLSFVVYGMRSAPRNVHSQHHSHDNGHAAATHTLAIVDALSADDLRSCSTRLQGWHDGGLATPLFVGANEFARSLDAFPFEFGAILSDHVVVSGANPFEGVSVDPADVRRACEIQARG